jgi:hypothetical protein
MTPPLTTPFKMVPLQKSAQGLRLAYLYTCSLPASHDEGMLRKAIAEHAGTTLRHLLPDQLFIAFDEALGVVYVVTGLRERSRPSLTFANGLQRVCGDDAGFCINHVGKGDSLAIDACLTQRLRNANLVKTGRFRWRRGAVEGEGSCPLAGRSEQNEQTRLVLSADSLLAAGTGSTCARKRNQEGQTCASGVLTAV